MTTNATSLERSGLRWLDLLFAVGVGAAVYWLSCLLVWPSAQHSGFGVQWQMMSEQPLGLVGQLPHRILAPFLAWCIGMGGADYVVFVRGLHVLLLTCVFLHCQRLGTTRIDALLVTCAVAITAPVQMYKLHWVGYSDPLGYSLFLIAAMCVRRTAVFWILFLLNLLTHELAVFLLPWLWVLRRQAGARCRDDLVWLAGAGAAYAAFYFWVRANGAERVYSYDYFAEHPLLPWGAIAIWALMLTHWLLAFGPVLAVLAWHQHRAESGRERWQPWLVLAGIVAILGIAFDWMRHANLIVLPFVLASARFLVAGHRLAYAGLLAASFLLLWIHPPWSAGSEPTRSLWTKVDELVITPQPVDFYRVVSDWLPAVWPTLAWVYALLAAIWMLGWWLARRDARAGASTTADRAAPAAPSC